MADDRPQEYFVDLVSRVSHANGVFRLTFAQQEADDGPRPVVRLMIPANQLAAIVRGINDAAVDIRDKVKSRAQAAPAANPRGEPAAKPQPVAGKAAPAKRVGRKAKK